MMNNATYTNTFSVRLPVDTIEFMRAYAQKEDRSVNYIIGKFLKEKVYELTAGDESC